MSVSQYQTLGDGIAAAEDAQVSLYGPVAATGWTLAVYGAFGAPSGPAAVSGMTVTYTGGAKFEITVGIPSAVTSDVAADTTLYLEVWRTDTGNKRPLARLAVPVYVPVNSA